ncbi:MAG: radical SAM protein [Deltaproteobacteria bacterium]|nr:radical SAM protein [Deltaproteobacteria bacterium]
MGVPKRSHVYGPVWSRRLGRSLGIDLIPYKICSYDCVYCQLGRTTRKTVQRREYVPLGEVLDDLRRRLAAGPTPDFVSLAGSGEPTLHAGLGELIAALKRRTTVPVAVLTNGSLLARPGVRRELARADLVLPSLDAGDARMFRRVNRPHPSLRFRDVVEGLAEFVAGFGGAVWLEVFLLAGWTTAPDQVRRLAELARRVGPARVQLNTVARPPAEQRAAAVPHAELVRLARQFDGPVDLLVDRPAAAPRGKTAGDLAAVLELLGRRPCTIAGMAAGLGLHPNDALKRVEALRQAGRVRAVRRGARTFYEAVH